jgi:DNA-binding FadR family transcriptional regulator
MLEREAASLAAERADPEELTGMEQALARFEGSTGVLELARADISIHAALAKMSHNPVIETMFASIAGLTFELMLRSLGDPSVSREGLPYHREIFEAIRDRDPERAREAIEGHLEVARRLYGTDLDESLDHIARQQLVRFAGSTVSLDDLIATVPVGPEMQSLIGSLPNSPEDGA